VLFSLQEVVHSVAAVLPSVFRCRRCWLDEWQLGYDIRSVKVMLRHVAVCSGCPCETFVATVSLCLRWQ